MSSDERFSQKSEDTFFASLEESSPLAVKTFRIRILDEDEMLLDSPRFDRWEKRFRAGKPVEPFVEHSYPSLEHVRQFLTPQRQFLYRVLRRKQPGSVYELAKMLGRPYKAVAEDLKVLKEMSLIRFDSEIVNGRARSKPVLTHKRLVIEFG